MAGPCVQLPPYWFALFGLLFSLFDKECQKEGKRVTPVYLYILLLHLPKFSFYNSDVNFFKSLWLTTSKEARTRLNIQLADGSMTG